MATKIKFSPDEVALYKRLANILLTDANVLVEKGRSYGASWKQRGGIGAFMMLARKWDRLENASKKHGYDVFEAASKDRRDEGIIDDIRDLRRYLALVEDHLTRDVWGEMAHRGSIIVDELEDSGGDEDEDDDFVDDDPDGFYMSREAAREAALRLDNEMLEVSIDVTRIPTELTDTENDAASEAQSMLEHALSIKSQCCDPMSVEQATKSETSTTEEDRRFGQPHYGHDEENNHE